MTRQQAEAAATHKASAALLPNCVFPIGVTVHV